MAVSPVKMVFSFFSAAVCTVSLILFDSVIQPLIDAWAAVCYSFGGNYLESVVIAQTLVPIALLIIGAVSIFVLIFTAFSNSAENNPYLEEIQRF